MLNGVSIHSNLASLLNGVTLSRSAYQPREGECRSQSHCRRNAAGRPGGVRPSVSGPWRTEGRVLLFDQRPALCGSRSCSPYSRPSPATKRGHWCRLDLARRRDRAQREVATMKERAPHLVKIGPIEMRNIQIGGEDLLCFSEELIDGLPLNTLLQQNGPLAPGEVIQLGQHVATAIGVLWQRGKIHRDIKPGNIVAGTPGDSSCSTSAWYSTLTTSLLSLRAGRHPRLLLARADGLRESSASPRFPIRPVRPGHYDVPDGHPVHPFTAQREHQLGRDQQHPKHPTDTASSTQRRLA